MRTEGAVATERRCELTTKRRGEKRGRQEMINRRTKQPQRVFKKKKKFKLMVGGDGPDRFTLQHRQNLVMKGRQKKGALSRNPI